MFQVVRITQCRLDLPVPSKLLYLLKRQAEYDLWHVRQQGTVGKLPDLRA